ncbi:uncharacterized protein FIBRA_04791 [Fibroporia radiculosa]|uniref:Uncharacterized protein n=1 Tax=Fibroporia radiculosa TaxID=599839 RepID=J4GPT8_9APHY|nr:uncharacterized protein FIBRA_04791 [Fibroporia radiculosa]CCM02685.1 predicted protein [Fibroporia radiculosa]
MPTVKETLQARLLIAQSGNKKSSATQSPRAKKDAAGGTPNSWKATHPAGNDVKKEDKPPRSRKPKKAADATSVQLLEPEKKKRAVVMPWQKPHFHHVTDDANDEDEDEELELDSEADESDSSS